MAALKLPRLPASPVESSVGGRAFVFAGFAVAVVAIAIYGQDYVVPAVALAAAAAGHVVSYRERAQKRGLWRQLLLASLIFVALFYVIADSALAIFGGVLPQANFAILLVAITSFDLKTRRNCYSSLWISLAIVYLAAVYAWDYTFGAVLIAWFACLAGFWMGSHLRRMETRLRFPRHAVAVSAMAAILLGFAFFIVVPQPTGIPISPLVISLPNFTAFKGDIENPALPLVQLTSAQAGATTSVDLHYRGRLGDTPVMYVRTGAPAYWRGVVFDTYRNGVWTASKRDYVEMSPYVPPRLLPSEPLDNLGTFVQTIRVLRPLPGVINAAYPIESLYAPVSSLREDAYGTFYTPDMLRPGQTYSVVSYLPNLSPQVLRSDAFPNLSQYVDASYTDYHALSGAAFDLASRATQGSRNQYDAVMALTTYLQRNYRYTLDLPRVPSGRDPVDWFLFDAKAGYCEQFATALALMLRSQGIPARLATGYATGDYDPVLDQSVVRERDAHAWVEVWFHGHGWVPVDPTPGVDPLAATRFPSHWAAGGMARLLPHLSIGAPVAAVGSAGFLGTVAPAIALALGVVFIYAWLRRRSRKRGFGAQPGSSDLLRLYDRVQRRLRRRRAPPETPLEYQHAMRSMLLEELTHAVNEGAYADRWPDPKRVREIALGVSAKSRRRL